MPAKKNRSPKWGWGSFFYGIMGMALTGFLLLAIVISVESPGQWRWNPNLILPVAFFICLVAAVVILVRKKIPKSL